MKYEIEEKRLREWEQLYLLLSTNKTRQKTKKVEEGGKEYTSTTYTHISTGGSLVQIGTLEYTGTGREIGRGLNDFYNQRSTGYQFHNALAFSGHPRIKELTNAFPYKLEKNMWNPLYFESLMRAHPLRGMKMLDLGCGPEPVFARITRLLGADTYTVDDNPASQFVYDPKSKLTRDWIELESKKHTVQDLNDPDALENIISKSKGNFDLISASLLLPVRDYGARTPNDKVLLNISYALLKEGGGFHLPLGGMFGETVFGIKKEKGFVTLDRAYADNVVEFHEMVA